VLSPIDVNNDKLFSANEVADVAADWLLPDEFISIDLSIPDTVPELRFCVGLVGLSLRDMRVLPILPRIAMPLTRIASQSDLSPLEGGERLRTHAAAFGKL
jgi:hypothetical protein